MIFLSISINLLSWEQVCDLLLESVVDSLLMSINLLSWEQVCDFYSKKHGKKVVGINLLSWEQVCDLMPKNLHFKNIKYQSPKLGASL